MLLLKKKDHFYIVLFYPLFYWTLTYIHMFWWKSKHQLFYTTNKILLKDHGALGDKAVAALELHLCQTILCHTGQLLKSQKHQMLSLFRALIPVFSLSQNTFVWLFTCGSPCVFKYYHLPFTDVEIDTREIK